MSTTRKTRVPMSEQLKLINQCRQSGLTDADWCRENGIAPSTFYNWVSRCRKAASDQIQEPSYGHLESPEYSCAMKSHFRKSGNQMSGKWKSSYASLLA